MSNGVERVLTLSFGKDGNEANHLGNGWSADEPGFRWMTGAASEVWVEHPGTGHDLILELDTTIMTGPLEQETQRLVMGVRGTGIARILMRRPGTVGFHVPAALLAAPGPVRLLFVHPDFRRPMDLHGGSDDRELSFAPRELRLSRVAHRGGLAAAEALPPEQMIRHFESLGENCEFGLVQRQLGVEPLGLLRFSFIELFQLLRGLRSGFAGLGDPATTSVRIEGANQDQPGEYVVREKAYDITYHTFQSPGDLALEVVQAQQATRLNFLRRKLLEDVANAEKIFVVKRNDPLRPEEVLPLFVALNEKTMNWLLWVVPADAAHPPGTVEVLLPGLLRGYVERFAPNDNAHDLALPGWAAICDTAWKAVGRSIGQAARPAA